MEAREGQQKMEVKNGRIKQCTEAELFLYWLPRWSDLFDFYSYKKACQALGTEITNEEEDKMTKEPETLEEFVEHLNPELRKKLAQSLEEYETPETPRTTAPARTCTNPEKMHEDLKNINKELHSIGQELDKINRTLNKRK